MCTNWRVLHIFAVLLLCDYGMFSNPTPSSTERTTIKISNTSDSNTTVTAESTTYFTESSADYDQVLSEFSEIPTSLENASVPKITVNKSEGPNRTSEEVIPRTARPESTTHSRTPLSPPREKKNESGSYTGGIIILIIILILIVLLLGLLYFLRKKGRSYSFDLTRADGPANDYDTPLRSEHQGISYEQTNKDLPVSLDYVHEDKPEEKSSPIANGCAGEKTEQTPANENEEQNSPEENSFTSSSCSTPPMKKVEFNLDLDLIGGDYELNDLSLSTADVSADVIDAPQNENNNNLFNAGRRAEEEIFTEISLDEPKQHA